jgi:hypothetical protein
MHVYSAEEIKEIKATDHEERSIHIQGNSCMTDAYTTHETSFEICEALKGQYNDTKQ